MGVVSFGGVLNWLTVTSGTTQLYRIVDSLLDAEIVLSYAWKDLDVIPPRTLPPRALVIALSPLLDERAVGALIDLRARGFDLAVVELSPFPFVPKERPRPSGSRTGSGGCGVTRSARSTRRWGSRSSSGTKVCRWRLSWRR